MSAQRKRQAVPTGQVIHGYRIGRTLGQGAFGQVTLGTSVEDGQIYAIKFIEKSQMSGLDDVERIYRECSILTSLRHDNVIRLFQVLDSNLFVLIVMEYAGGGELQEYVHSQGGVLTEQHACFVLSKIVAGLEYCHRKRIIHRDLKSENILLDAEGNLKIADFGLSNTVVFGQENNTWCGTPSYIAPELIPKSRKKSTSSSMKREKSVPNTQPAAERAGKTAAIETYNKDNCNAACDVWSLGVIAFSLLCGYLPFESAHLPTLFRKIQEGQFSVPEYVSAEARDLLGAMLTVDPLQRITLASVRNHVWMQMDLSQIPKPSASQIQAAHTAQQRGLTHPSLGPKNELVDSSEASKQTKPESEAEGKTDDSPSKTSESLKRTLSTEDVSPKNHGRNKQAISQLRNKLAKLKKVGYNQTGRKNKARLDSGSSSRKGRFERTASQKSGTKTTEASSAAESEVVSGEWEKQWPERASRASIFESPIVDSLLKRRVSQDDLILWQSSSTLSRK